MLLPEKRPRILLWDIETSPILVTTWSLWKPILGHENIQKENSLISAAWKWLDEDSISSASVSASRPRNDKALVTKIHEVLSSADVIVGHNGDKFDLRKFKARAIFWGLPPIPNVQTIDTLKVARAVFSFNSNRLDYLGKFLCGEGKIRTSYGLWLEVLKGNKEALAEMVTYNEQDVLLLEKVYKRLRPYIKDHPNVSLYRETLCCTKCGSVDYQSRGWSYSKVRKRKKYQCKNKSCGGWFVGEFVKNDTEPAR